MLGVGHQRRRIDPPADDELVAGHPQVPGDAEDGAGHARGDVRGVVVARAPPDLTLVNESTKPIGQYIAGGALVRGRASSPPG